MSKLYNCLPSDVLSIEDSYTAFCFNEACCYITFQLQNDMKPQYKVIKENKAEKKEYKNFKDFYKQYQ